MTDPRPHLALRKELLTVLAATEIATRGNAGGFDGARLHATGRHPHLSVEDLDYLLDLLGELGYLKVTRMYGGDSALYQMNPQGRKTALYHTSTGKTELEIPNPNAGGNQFHIGQGAQSPMTNINTGSGTLNATQNVQIGPAQQAEVLQVLHRLAEVLDNMDASTNRNVAADIVRTATEAAQQSDWSNFAGRMQGALAFLAMLASLTADGATALELGRRALTLVSGGT